MRGVSSVSGATYSSLISPLRTAPCSPGILRRRASCSGRAPARPAASQLLHLVLHQGDQRRDHHRQPLEDQRRDLVAQRFAAAGGHDRQRVALVQHVFESLRAAGV